MKYEGVGCNVSGCGCWYKAYGNDRIGTEYEGEECPFHEAARHFDMGIEEIEKTLERMREVGGREYKDEEVMLMQAELKELAQAIVETAEIMASDMDEERK